MLVVGAAAPVTPATTSNQASQSREASAATSSCGEGEINVARK